jgi:hypothetical protein
MPFIDPIDGQLYRTRKQCLLQHIFDTLTYNGTQGIGEDHAFFLQDIIEAYQTKRLRPPTSSSNFVLDLCRKYRPITSRVPDSIMALGYDLRKKTGPDVDAKNYAGEFIYVGVGNAIESWLVWPEEPDEAVTISNTISSKILRYLRNDEAALFSVIDHCDVLSQVIYDRHNSILRIQNPMKWQPNEIDGLYFSDHYGEEILYPIEAKALSTKDDINLDQMLGAYKTLHEKAPGTQIAPLAIMMDKNGLRIGKMKLGLSRLSPVRSVEEGLVIEKYTLAKFDPPIPSWNK